MRVFKFIIIIALLFTVSAALSAEKFPENCSSAVISGEASLHGVPVLWKNRDTDYIANKVVYVKESPYSYIGLVNTISASGREVYAGLNSAGFAIMNTVGVNLPLKASETKDLEGIIMGDALRTCKTVEDFENYIKSNLGPHLGSKANFGVFDASGKILLFEIHNHGYKKFDPLTDSKKYLVNTNFSRSGKEGAGAGYLRFERATELFNQFKQGKVDFYRILREFTRDTGHVLLKNPTWEEMKKTPAGEDNWIITRDCINKYYTSSAAVLTGKGKKTPATMWVVPGEPVCAISLPLWVEAGSVPEEFWKGEQSELWKESMRLKKIIRPQREGSKKSYLNLAKLDNAGGTGFLPKLLETEEKIFKMTKKFLKKNRKPEELAAFQKKMAAMALATMKSIK